MTVRQRASTNDSRTPLTEAAKWNCAIVNGITYTCALPTLTRQNAVEENSLLRKKNGFIWQLYWNGSSREKLFFMVSCFVLVFLGHKTKKKKKTVEWSLNTMKRDP